MWRYEVAWFNEDGIYTWKGFGHVNKFERFLKRLKKKGLRIMGIVNMDGPEERMRFEEMYLSK